jgi:hypothetical protein
MGGRPLGLTALFFSNFVFKSELRNQNFIVLSPIKVSPLQIRLRMEKFKICLTNSIVEQIWRHFCFLILGPGTKLLT